MADYLEDLRSDFSVFHRVDDIDNMPSRQFFPLAERLVAYKGVLRARVEAEMEKQQKTHDPNTNVVSGDAASLQSEFGDFIEIKRG